MPTITFQGQAYQVESTESLLDGLSRQGVELPHSCRAGVCHSCMMRATQGTPPADAQNGLKDNLKHQGYFLACICKTTQDLGIALADDEATHKIEATLIDKHLLAPDIARLRLRPNASLNYQAGQFINVHHDNLVRSYSLASVAELGESIELHVRKLAQGRMSTWLVDEIQTGATLTISGPEGSCFYLPGKPEQSLMLVATGTGLAPLWGIVRDALRQGHSGPIHLYHGSRNRDGLYLVEELRAMDKMYPNFHYLPCLSGEQIEGFAHGRAEIIALQQHPKLDQWRIFLCGHPVMVESTKKKTFLAGASLAEINADPYITSSN